MSTAEIAHEQAHLDMLHTRVETLRDDARHQLAGVLREAGGTRQGRLEREAAAGRYAAQVARYDAAENGLCFGRLDLRDGDRYYIGRVGLPAESADDDPLLLDWRAPAARPFYVATPAAPHGVRKRRHITTRGDRVVRLDDEVLDRDGVPVGELTGEAALLASLDAGRTGRMHDIVATLQAEQDVIIRSDHRGVLVVQGGPGTGKTAVALHRAAYLLYTHRQLASRGVLVVGPNPTFIGYIGQVLPGLGENSVLLSTVGELFPGVRADRTELPETAELKGRTEMAAVIAAAVRDRQVPAGTGLEVEFDGDVVRLDHEECVRAADAARATRLPHNRAAPVFRQEIVAALARRSVEDTRHLADRLEADIAEVLAEADLDRAVRADLDALPGLLGEEDSAAAQERTEAQDIADVQRMLATDADVRAALDALWPPLTAQQLLTDLYGDRARLASAAHGLTRAERELLYRAPGGGWTAADVPLLDEIAELLGQDNRAAEAAAAAERAEGVAYAQGVLDLAAGEGEDEESLTGMLDAETLADRHEERMVRTVAERALADRDWVFGHIIVDEAQELSQMAWRLLMRRCPTRSMTLVGDVAQTGDAAGASSWASALAPHVGDRWRQVSLTVNYRTPAEIMASTTEVLAALGPGLQLPRSVRETGLEPWRMRTEPSLLARTLADRAAKEAAALEDGRLAVLVPDARRDELGAAVAESVPDAVYGDEPDLESRVVVLGVRQAKGLEFDAVLIADPTEILARSTRGLNDLYVALTRATQRLGIIHAGPAPAVLEGTVTELT
ncbi:ATP-binding domain-containing protein [Streptomyces sp. AM2-3-1]|uniref:HelD family protein n=1 Tax=Streptomyces sp. AM2-3-1 TaxID=3075824 RepID=UPI0028C45DA5|nr:ATP-binding domain-containing protein [Streptomyces sp. AM2-3-1]WNO66933.1 ATP-binding domain-containing protein [Streptomyces sp. AM2-3-1]